MLQSTGVPPVDEDENDGELSKGFGSFYFDEDED